MKSLCFTTKQGNYTPFKQQIEISRDQIKLVKFSIKYIFFKLK